MNTPLLSFNGGELTPYLRYRADFNKHPSGAARLENLLPLPHGGITKRPGTKYVSKLPDTPTASIAFPFTATDASTYIILITAANLYVIGTDGALKATLTYLSAGSDPTRTQYAQINDIAYLTHPDTHPRLLQTTGDTAWTIENLSFSNPPVRTQNLDPLITIRITANPQASDWTNAASYTTSTIIYDPVAFAEFTCIANHTSSSTNRPSSPDSQSFWRRRLYQPGDAVTLTTNIGTPPTAWAASYTSYALKSVIRLNPATYTSFKNPPPLNKWSPTTTSNFICILAHSALPEPSGNQNLSDIFPTYWAPIRPSLPLLATSVLGDHVLQSSRLFKCKVASTTIRPLAAGWAAAWDEITPFTPTDLNVDWVYPSYSVSAAVESDGTNYQATVTHLITAGSEPVTANAATWPRYWRFDPEEIFTPFHGSDANSPGSYWQLSPSRSANDFQIELKPVKTNNNTASQPIAVQGVWNFNTFGTWHGTFQIQRSTNNGSSWESFASYQSSADRNIAAGGDEATAVLLRLYFIEAASTAATTTDARAILTPASNSITAPVLADTYVSPAVLTGEAIAPILSGVTHRWSEGSYSTFRGFPQALTFHDSRLVFAATSSQPTTLWFSKTDEYDNFLIGTDATDAIAVTLTTAVKNRIRWLASQRRLFIGTATEEWIIGSDTTDRAITPTNILARQHTFFGSAHIHPSPLADSFVFLSQNRQRLREIAYVDERAAYSAPELTRLADHLTISGIRQLAWQQTREPSLWATTEDGRLLNFAFNREDLIAAWTQHTSQNTAFLHVLTFTGNNGDDLVFIIANRTLDETTYTTLELIPENWSNELEDPTTPHPNPYDLQLSTTDTTILLPDLFLNTPLEITTNGTITRTVTATTNQINLGTGTHHIGIPITSTLETLPLDIGTGSPDGTIARRKRLHAIKLALVNSAGGSVTYGTLSEPIPLTTPFTGWIEIPLHPGHQDDAVFTITHSQPYPFTLRAAALLWNQTERPT